MYNQRLTEQYLKCFSWYPAESSAFLPHFVSRPAIKEWQNSSIIAQSMPLAWLLLSMTVRNPLTGLSSNRFNKRSAFVQAEQRVRVCHSRARVHGREACERPYRGRGGLEGHGYIKPVPREDIPHAGLKGERGLR